MKVLIKKTAIGNDSVIESLIRYQELQKQLDNKAARLHNLAKEKERREGEILRTAIVGRRLDGERSDPRSDAEIQHQVRVLQAELNNWIAAHGELNALPKQIESLEREATKLRQSLSGYVLIEGAEVT